jgi:hypothetical protein
VAAAREALRILRREHLGQHPSVFRSLTGLTVEAFDHLLPELCAAFAAARRRRLDRPDRHRALGGGDGFDLAVADQFLLTVVWLRHYPTQECLGYLFGVSDATALRAVRRCLPILEQSGKASMRLPDPGKGHRRDLPALRKQTPALAVLVDTFEQRTHRPQRRQRASYSGKQKAHTRKSQVAVDADGRVVAVADRRPGRWADLKGRWATWATWASTASARGCAPPRRGASRAARAGRRKTGVPTGRSRGGGSRSSTLSVGCAATRR